MRKLALALLICGLPVVASAEVLPEPSIVKSGFAQLAEHFEMAQVPDVRELQGWHAGRCFAAFEPMREVPGALILKSIETSGRVLAKYEVFVSAGRKPAYFEDKPDSGHMARLKHDADAALRGADVTEVFSGEGALSIVDHKIPGRYDLRTDGRNLFVRSVDLNTGEDSGYCYFSKRISQGGE